MHQIPIDKILMTLSVLLTSTPENKLQLNSQPTDVSQFLRFDGDNISGARGKVQGFSNQSTVIDNLINNQLKMTERIEEIASNLETLNNHLSALTEGNGCFGKKVGQTIMKVPSFPNGFPVQCVSNAYGDNWLLVARINPHSNFLDGVPSQEIENSVGKFDGEYFMGFKHLRAITDADLYELLTVTEYKYNKVIFYDHYEAIAFDSANNVKLIGQHRTNYSLGTGLNTQILMLNEKISMWSNDGKTIYLRKTTLDAVPQLKGI
ncbi:uncharacterized protein [Eurosta solidaginis]|uniref:uncharacterized protein n=1 Tax=Eurosta solidaginis TaxID=178769 RepID=UPI003530EC1B